MNCFSYLMHHPTAASTNNLEYTLCSIPGTPPSGSSFGVVVTASNDIAFSLNSASCRSSFNSAVSAKKLSRSRGRNGVSFGERQPRKSNSVGDFSRTRKWFVRTVPVKIQLNNQPVVRAELTHQVRMCLVLALQESIYRKHSQALS